MTDPIVKTVEVPCSAAEAFEVFTARIGSWWPLDSFAASVRFGRPALDATIEPRVGGAVYETMHDGGRDDWGEVLVWAPGRAFACTWMPGNNKASPTRVDVAFEDIPGGRCRVTLTHSGWEAWGDKAREARDGYDGGWATVFEHRFAGACLETA